MKVLPLQRGGPTSSAATGDDRGDDDDDDGVPYIHIYRVFIQEISSHHI